MEKKRFKSPEKKVGVVLDAFHTFAKKKTKKMSLIFGTEKNFTKFAKICYNLLRFRRNFHRIAQDFHRILKIFQNFQKFQKILGQNTGLFLKFAFDTAENEPKQIFKILLIFAIFYDIFPSFFPRVR